MRVLALLILVSGCRKNPEDEPLRPPDDPSLEAPDEGFDPDDLDHLEDSGDTAETGDPGDTEPPSPTVTVVPWIEGISPLTFYRHVAPSWLAVFDGTDWTEPTLGQTPDPIPVAAAPDGRFAVAYACPADGRLELRVFLGHVDDGDELLLRGCPTVERPEDVRSTITVNANLYGDRPAGNEPCGAVRYAGASWFPSCNRVTSIDLFTDIGGPNHLFAQRYDAEGRTDRVVFRGPLTVPEGGLPQTLDFAGADSADPAEIDVSSDLTSIGFTMVLPWNRVWISRVPADAPGVYKTIPASLAPKGTRWFGQVNRTLEEGVFLTDSETVHLETPPATLTLGELFDDVRPAITFTDQGDGSVLAGLTSEPDWSVLTVNAFPTGSTRTIWQLAASRGFLGDATELVIPDPAEMTGLLEAAEVTLGKLTAEDLVFPSSARWSLEVQHARGTVAATPFEVWRGAWFVDHFADGTRVIRQVNGGER